VTFPQELHTYFPVDTVFVTFGFFTVFPAACFAVFLTAGLVAAFVAILFRTAVFFVVFLVATANLPASLKIRFSLSFPAYQTTRVQAIAASRQ